MGIIIRGYNLAIGAFLLGISLASKFQMTHIHVERDCKYIIDCLDDQEGMNSWKLNPLLSEFHKHKSKFRKKFTGLGLPVKLTRQLMAWPNSLNRASLFRGSETSLLTAGTKEVSFIEQDCDHVKFNDDSAVMKLQLNPKFPQL